MLKHQLFVVKILDNTVRYLKFFFQYFYQACGKINHFFSFLVYLEIGNGENDQGALEFTFDDTVDNGRQFEIKVTQIYCDTVSK